VLVPSPNPIIARRAETATHFRAEDCNDPRFYIAGNLDAGTLTFEVVTVRGSSRSAGQGHEFFDAMIDKLRQLFLDGATPSQLMHHIAQHHEEDGRLHFAIMDYFREAFGIPLLRHVVSDESHGA
jgi:hypothetical protein